MSSKKRLSPSQQNNQGAAGMIRRLVASSLGPKGLSKIVTNDMGDIFFASECAMMLEKANYKHPIAKMMFDLAKGINARYGDGSATAVLLACALIEEGFDLVEQGISPSMTIEAYEKARDESIDFLEDLRINAGKAFLFRAISTSLSSKIPMEETNHVANVINSAVEHVWRKGENFDAELIKTIAKEGGSVLESKVIEGIGIDTEVISGRMPSAVRDARIAIVEELFDVRKTKFNAEVRINDASSIGALQRAENDMVAEMVRNVIDSGANVLLTHKGIEEPAPSMLVDHNILVARRVGGVDLRRISKATGAKIVYSSSELSKEHLGFASLVEERALGGDKWLFIDGCKDPRAVSILMRSGSQRSADHLENL
ncbi:MAG: TCP-1/cpn60 chaperonin family protein, partial [Thaumarchaeota archaeon]|nr:TCP-1/cpn60 chaperonin family protein [Nitrososphaerota archaeon]